MVNGGGFDGSRICRERKKSLGMVSYEKIILGEGSHGNTAKKFPVYEIYLDGVIITKVSSENEALEMVSRWQKNYR